MSEKKLPDINYLKERLKTAMDSLAGISSETAAALRERNTREWICTMMAISGCELGRDRIRAMVDGEMVPEATLEEFRLLESFRELRRELGWACDMHTETDSTLLEKFHMIISGSGLPCEYRKTAPRIREMDYTPPSGADVPEIMADFARELSRLAVPDDPLYTGVLINDMVMAVMPYEEYSQPLAFAAMSSYFLNAGYPLPVPDISRYDHLRLAAEYVHRGTSRGLLSMVLISFIQECRLPEGDI